ncbi:hypothetical protein CSB08_00060 [Candidatus Gracilibacteria bacterium]|nr:MAG: hypothetical protein CSB08_00060 [Candidatus Gracilibacteria bacterium]PIE85699.1 MAG: hypothetical protein CSA08_00680 [Candidatus Gracilibacteria bacterium]
MILMILYKNLLFSFNKASFLEENANSEIDNGEILKDLLEKGEITERDIAGYKKIQEFLKKKKTNSLPEEMEEADSLPEEIQDNIEGFNKNIKDIINNYLELNEQGIKTISNKGDYTIFSRRNGENNIMLDNSKNIITDENGFLGKLDFEGYTTSEALKEVDDILTALEEAQMFKSPSLERKERELKEAFRLKYAIYIKNDLV